MAVFGDARLTRALWPHQERALARVDLSREATYLVVPPGGGKTLTVLTYQAVCADSSIHQEGTALLCSLDDIAMATADALHTAGLAARGADSVRVEVLPDGGYRARYPPSPPRNPRLSPTRSMRCSHRSPSPRYIVPRYIIERPPGTFGTFLLTARRLVTGQVPATVVYHAVPAVLAGNKKAAAIFARSWNARVSPGEPLYSSSPEGAGILAVSRGDDPFAITTQIRTLWR